MPASANTVVGVEWVAKLDGYKKQMAQIPGVTDKQLKEMGKLLDKGVKGMEKTAKAGAGKTKSAWESAFKGIGDAAKGAGFGGLTEQVTHFASAFAELATPAGVALAAVGAGAAALAVTVGGAALVVGTLGEGLVEAGFNAKGALKELHGFELIGSDFYPTVPPASLASFDRLAASGDALDSIWNRLTVNVATNTAPQLERLVDVAVGLGVKAEAMFEVWSAGKDLFVELDKLVVESTLRAFLPLSDAVRLVGRSYIGLSDIVGHKVDPALRTAFDSTEGLRDALVANDAALVGSLPNMDALAAAGKKLLQGQVRATAATTAHAKATGEDAEAIKAAKEAQDRLNRGMELADQIRQAGNDASTSNLTGIDKERTDLAEKLAAVEAEHHAEQAALGAANTALLGLDQEYEDARQAIIQASGERVQKLREAETEKVLDLAHKAQKEQEASWTGVANASISAVERLSSAFAKSYDTTTVEGRKAAKAQWKTQHEIAIATTLALAVVSGIQAAASAPWPSNLPAMIASSIESTASIAAVSAIQPSFHAGGLAPDEVTMGGMKTQDEEGIGVISRQGMGRFRQANAGITPQPASTTVVMQLRHSVEDKIVAQCIQRNGMTARAIAKNSDSVPFGHRRDTWRR